MADYIYTYAQNREDILLAGFFVGAKKGFYVDVGANEPTFDSVTKKFYIEGWRGINIEPNKRLFKAFEFERPEDINLQLGVSDRAGTLTLRDYEDGSGLSTFSDAIKEDYLKHSTEVTEHYHDIEVPVLPLRDILQKHAAGKQINFMKIDVEGYEYEVISGNDWDTYRPQVLCIESVHIVKDWRPMLKKYHYTFVFFDGLNNYYVADEHKEIKERFSYPQAALAKVPIPYDVGKQIKRLEVQAKQADQKTIQQDLIIQGLAIQINTLNAQIQANKRIKSLVKQLVRGLHKAMLVRIENLNKPRVHTQAVLKIPATNKPAQILRTIQVYDLSRYYSSRSTEPLNYRAIHGLYTSFSRGAFLTLRAARRVIRRSK